MFLGLTNDVGGVRKSEHGNVEWFDCSGEIRLSRFSKRLQELSKGNIMFSVCNKESTEFCLSFLVLFAIRAVYNAMAYHKMVIQNATR